MLNETIEKIIEQRDEARGMLAEMFRLRCAVYNQNKMKYVYHVPEMYFETRDYLIEHGFVNKDDCKVVGDDE